MPFVRPTLPQLISQVKSDIETHLSGTDPLLRRSFEAIIARAQAGAVHGLHGHLVWLSKQLIPDTAEGMWIERWASIWGLTKTAPQKATGTITVTGVVATVCPLGTVWQTADEVQYTQDAALTIPGGGSITTTITAVEADEDGNQAAGVIVSLVSPVAGIDSDATVDASGLTNGLDQETDEALLARLLLRLQSPPKGGGPGDYINWALEVAGVTRAWEYPLLDGAGTVGVYFVCDDLTPIIPNAAKVLEVQTYLDEVVPVTADATAYAPTDTAFTLSTYLTPNTTTVQDAVLLELADLIYRKGYPGCEILLSQVNEAISLATGETDHLITVIMGGAVADKAFVFPAMPTFDPATAVTWLGVVP